MCETIKNYTKTPFNPVLPTGNNLIGSGSFNKNVAVYPLKKYNRTPNGTDSIKKCITC